MEQNQNTNQLNGYKFSFNRVNPYLNASGQSSQINSERVQNKDLQKSSNLLSPSSNSIHKNTKQIFYKRQNENEKNKVLIDLYLRKTKFNKIKSREKKIDGAKQQKEQKIINNIFGNRSSNLHKEKFNNINFSELHIQVSNLTETKEEQQCHDNSNNERYLRQQKLGSESFLDKNHKLFKHHTGITSPKSKISSSLRIQQPNQQLYEQKQISHKDSMLKKQPRTTNRKSQKHPNYKIYRNFSENKFNPYLAASSPKNNSRFKNQKSGTTPIQKFNQIEKSISLLKIHPAVAESNINPMLTIQTSSQQKPNKKIGAQFKIKPEKTDDPKQIHTNFQKLISPRQNLDNLNSKNKLQPLRLQSLKSANQQITNKKHFGLMGHIKYKSPRMMLSSRNQLFKSKNEPPKIKLFTEEEETNIIQEFYSQEKQSKKGS